MKRIGNIYDKILDTKVIDSMYKKIKRSTKNKRKIEVFESNYVSNISFIKEMLENRSYIPSKYNIFLVKEPKLRIIMSQNIIDKIINHVVSQYFLINIFESTLIEENVATRKNKGTKEGIVLLKKYLNEIKNEKFYVLKFDISKYFFNLDHDIIKELLEHKIKDKDVLKILCDIVDSTDSCYVNERINSLKKKEIKKITDSNCKNKDLLIKEIKELPNYEVGKGLPIGNMSSQFLAILYLNELDYFIKNKLKIKYYIRYMDDGVIIHQNKEYLQYCLEEINKILERYKLKLNKKTKIYSCKEGFEFLGFRYIIKNNKVIMKVKNSTKKRFKRKIKEYNKLLDKNKLSEFDYNQVLASYKGHLSYGNTNNLVYSNLSNGIIKLRSHMVTINSNGEVIYLNSNHRNKFL